MLRSLRREERREDRRDDHRSYENTKQYYEDLGLSTSPDIYAQIKEEEAAYQEQRDSALAELGSAASELEGGVDAAWSSAVRGYTPVQVVNENTIEGTYYIPREYASQVYDNFSQYYPASWVDGNSKVNIDVNSFEGGKRGQEIHDTLSTLSSDIKDSFYETASKQFDESQALIDAQYDYLDDVEGLREEQYATSEQEYLDRIENMESTFSNIARESG